MANFVIHDTNTGNFHTSPYSHCAPHEISTEYPLTEHQANNTHQYRWDDATLELVLDDSIIKDTYKAQAVIDRDRYLVLATGGASQAEINSWQPRFLAAQEYLFRQESNNLILNVMVGSFEGYTALLAAEASLTATILGITVEERQLEIATKFYNFYEGYIVRIANIVGLYEQIIIRIDNVTTDIEQGVSGYYDTYLNSLELNDNG